MTSQEIDQLIYNTAIQQGFSPVAAKLIVAQARFESADYQSAVFRANNNTSGMKYIGQPLASRGTPAPANERTCNLTCNSDFYAKFGSVQDSATDKIVRLYSKTMGGVTPEQLKNVKDADEFARLLKKRRYYGPSAYGTAGAEKEISQYARGMRAKLLKINVLEFVKKNSTLLIAGLILLVGGSYFLYKKIKK
jgi:LPXTG-motif cell wall-anchored protein